MSYLQLTNSESSKLQVIQDTLKLKLTNGQAAKILNLSIRQIKRLKQQVRNQGSQGIIHQLKNRVGNHRLDAQTKQQVLTLFQEHYTDFKPSFAAEKLQEIHGISINPETLRLWLIEAGVWQAHSQKPVKYYAFRQRLDYLGQLQQFDGSYHYWFEGRLLDELGNPLEVCLLAAIDDATGRITQAKFDYNEGVFAVYQFWREYVETLGKPLKIYLDKFSTYKINHKAALDNADLLTQFQQVVKLMDVELIHANSPQAKGRVERLFKTLQDRLVKELRLANINTIEEANHFLIENFIPRFNTKFSVAARKAGDIHRLLTQSEKKRLDSIFSIKHLRVVNHDFTIQFKNLFYQLEEIQPTTIRPKDKVTVQEWLDGTIHFQVRNHHLKYFVLSQKPKRIASQPAILTKHPLNWKPPANHPWRLPKLKPPTTGG